MDDSDYLVTLLCKSKGHAPRTLYVPPSMLVGAVRAQVAQEYGLIESSVKLLGLAKGRRPDDATPLGQVAKVRKLLDKRAVSGPQKKKQKKQETQPSVDVRGEEEREGEEKAKLKAIKVMVVGTPLSAAEEVASLLAAESAYEERREEEEARRVQEEARRAEEERVRAVREEEERQRRAEREAERRMAREAERVAREAERAARVARGEEQHPQLRREQSASSEVELQLRVVSSRAAGRAELDGGYRVVLPPAVLQQCVDARVLFPLTFRVSNGPPTDEAAPVYAGVVDFEAPADMVIVPRELMELAGLAEGDLAFLSNINLELGTFAKLVPLEAAWLEVDEEERQALLEFELRKHTFLAVGMVLSLPYQGQEFTLRVLETQPAEVVSITNTDLTTEVAPPEAVSSSSAAANSRIVLQPDVPSDLIRLDPGAAVAFSFHVDDPNLAVRVEPVRDADVDEPLGDPDLYVSVSAREPNPSNFHWAAQQVGAQAIELSSADTAFRLGTYFGSLRAYPAGGPVTCRLVYTASEKVVSEAEAAAVAASLAASPAAQAPPNTRECGNCGRFIPLASFSMHELRCARHVYKCGKCGKTLERSAKAKHDDLVHADYICECGAGPFEQDTLMVHRHAECPLRLVQCIYCAMQVPVRERGPHQGECGTRPGHCRVCRITLLRKELRYHMRKEHDVDTETITWRDFV